MLNFKGKKRVDKSDSKEEPETGNRKAQVLAVWGSPG